MVGLLNRIWKSSLGDIRPWLVFRRINSDCLCLCIENGEMPKALYGRPICSRGWRPKDEPPIENAPFYLFFWVRLEREQMDRTFLYFMPAGGVTFFCWGPPRRISAHAITHSPTKKVTNEKAPCAATNRCPSLPQILRVLLGGFSTNSMLRPQALLRRTVTLRIEFLSCSPHPKLRASRFLRPAHRLVLH